MSLSQVGDSSERLTEGWPQMSVVSAPKKRRVAIMIVAWMPNLAIEIDRTFRDLRMRLRDEDKHY